MELKLEAEELEGLVVVQLAGDLELSNAPRLREQLLPMCDRTGVTLLVDLTEVSFLDSTAVGVLVAVLKRVREQGGSMSLVCPQARVKRIFAIAGLTDALSVYDTRAAALESLIAGRNNAVAAGGEHE